MVLCAIFLDDGRRVTGIFETRADPIEALRQQNRVNTAQSALAKAHCRDKRGVRGEMTIVCREEHCPGLISAAGYCMGALSSLVPEL